MTNVYFDTAAFFLIKCRFTLALSSCFADNHLAAHQLRAVQRPDDPAFADGILHLYKTEAPRFSRIPVLGYLDGNDVSIVGKHLFQISFPDPIVQVPDVHTHNKM